MLAVQAALRASRATAAAAPSRAFSAVAVDPIVARAREMQKTPYDPAKEGKITAPAYDGWDSKIQEDFVKLTTGKKAGGRPYEEICESALDLIGFTPMVRMSRLA